MPIVRVQGFEPWASCSQNRRSTKLSYTRIECTCNIGAVRFFDMVVSMEVARRNPLHWAASLIYTRSLRVSGLLRTLYRYAAHGIEPFSLSPLRLSWEPIPTGGLRPNSSIETIHFYFLDLECLFRSSFITRRVIWLMHSPSVCAGFSAGARIIHNPYAYYSLHCSLHCVA